MTFALQASAAQGQSPKDLSCDSPFMKAGLELKFEPELRELRKASANGQIELQTEILDMRAKPDQTGCAATFRLVTRWLKPVAAERTVKDVALEYSYNVELRRLRVMGWENGRLKCIRGGCD